MQRPLSSHSESVYTDFGFLLALVSIILQTNKYVAHDKCLNFISNIILFFRRRISTAQITLPPPCTLYYKDQTGLNSIKEVRSAPPHPLHRITPARQYGHMYSRYKTARCEPPSADIV